MIELKMDPWRQQAHERIGRLLAMMLCPTATVGSGYIGFCDWPWNCPVCGEVALRTSATGYHCSKCRERPAKEAT